MPFIGPSLRSSARFLILFAGTVPCIGQTNPGPIFESVVQTATAAREAGHTATAIGEYRQAVTLKPDWGEGWWYLGTLLYEANQFNEAKESFEKVTQLLPSMGSAWNFLGLCEFEMRSFSDARAHLEKGQSLGAGDDPEIARVAAYHLALLRIRDGDFELASSLLLSSFPETQPPDQIGLALGLALLRVPLLPTEVDLSRESWLRSAGEASISAARGDVPAELARLGELVKAHPEMPYLHYVFGNALAASNHLPEALAQQRLETKLSPDSALPWIVISSLELQSGHLDSARKAAERAAQLAPRSQAAHRALAESLRASGQVEEALQESQLAESLAPEKASIDSRIARLYRSADSANVETDDLIRKQAMLDYALARYPQAASELKLWLQSKPQDGTSWAVLGLSEFEMKDYDNALLHLQRGRDLGFGGSPEAMQLANYRLGLLLNHSAQFEKAMSVLSPDAGSGPLKKDAQFALGMALLRISRFPDQIDPSLRPTVAKAGATAEFLRASHYDEAFANFESMLKQSPRVPFLHYAYGTALVALSRYDEAEIQMREESQISPASELPYVRIASIATRRHRPAEAIPAAQHALKLAPHSAEAHYLLGRALLESGDIPSAVAELETAGQLEPNSPQIHFNLAKAYTRAKLPEKAEQERALFVQLNKQAEQQRSREGDQSYEGPRDAFHLETNNEPAPTPR